MHKLRPRTCSAPCVQPVFVGSGNLFTGCRIITVNEANSLHSAGCLVRDHQMEGRSHEKRNSTAAP
jgi:hypothetical protein